MLVIGLICGGQVVLKARGHGAQSRSAHASSARRFAHRRSQARKCRRLAGDHCRRYRGKVIGKAPLALKPDPKAGGDEQRENFRNDTASNEHATPRTKQQRDVAGHRSQHLAKSIDGQNA